MATSARDDPAVLAEIEAYIRAQYEAFRVGDVAAIDPGWGQGFGFRSRSARVDLPEAVFREHTRRFFAQMESYEIAIDELNVVYRGGVGIVWGSHTESGKVSGRPPERVKVRFSMTLEKTVTQGWRVLMGHRDIQPFDADGRCIPAEIESSSDADDH